MRADISGANRTAWLYYVGAALVALNVCQYLLSREPKPSASVFVALQIVAGCCYLVAVFLVVMRGWGVGFGYLLGVAIACRFVLLPSPVLFDNDIYRYLWDGNVFAHGINPFMQPPNSAGLAALRDGCWSRIGYPEVRTIYPPLAQMVFGLAHVLGLETALGLKSIFLIFDVANVFLIAALLARLGRPKSWVIIYAWSPLAMKEFANSGHIEPVMLFFLLLALVFWLRQRPRPLLAGMSFGAAILVKLVPVILLPLAWRLGKWRSLAAAAAVVMACYLPFASAGTSLFSGIGTYGKYWTFNYSAYALFQAAESLARHTIPILPLSPARMFVGLLTIGYSVRAGLRVRPEDARRRNPHHPKHAGCMPAAYAGGRPLVCLLAAAVPVYRSQLGPAASHCDLQPVLSLLRQQHLPGLDSDCGVCAGIRSSWGGVHLGETGYKIESVGVWLTDGVGTSANLQFPGF